MFVPRQNAKYLFGVLHIGQRRLLFLTPKSTGYELLLALRCFVNTGPDLEISAGATGNSCITG